MNDIIVLPNLIPPTFADEIERAMLSIDFPWHYRKNVSSQPNDPKVFENDPNIKIRDAFIHLFYDQKEEIVTPYADLVRPILYCVSDRTKLTVENIMRMRAVLTYKDPYWNKEDYLTPHVDDISPEHTHTFIYYVNDCDGDTLIYDEFYTTWNNYNKRTLVQRVTPKKGTGVLINGMRYHSNEVGRDEHRVVINMNLTLR